MSDEPTLLEPGGTFGDFTVVALLGRGAMGEVYKITDGAASYALKIMSTASVDNDPAKRHDSRKRFVREAEAAMKISHPNLVAVYDVGEDPETHLCYILMEYVGGGSLAERIRRKGKLDIREAVSITMHVAKALDAAHRLGVVHRDIKPANIMFTSDGVPKLADLGIARVQGGGEDTTLTKTDMIIGTPAYMSPEQMMNSHDVDARADIYSLGIVLYEMLTGVRPNKDATVVQLLARAIKGEELPDVREMRPEVSAALACAVARMVAQKAEDRPQTAAEAARLVYDAVTGKMTAKAGAGWAARAEALRRREGKSKGAWRLAAFLGGTAAVAALVAAILLRPARAPQPPAEVTRVREVVVTNVVNVVREQRAAPSRPDDELVSLKKRMDLHLPVDVRSAIANDSLWFYKLENDCALLCRAGEKPCVFPEPKGTVVVPKMLDGHKVTVVGDCAFARCNGLTAIDLPDSLLTIGVDAFRETALTSITFPPSVVRVSNHAFTGSRIERVALNLCKDVHGSAFACCPQLKEVGVSPQNESYASVAGALYTKDLKGLVLYPAADQLRLPSSVEVIGGYALSNVQLSHLKLPDGVRKFNSPCLFWNGSVQTIEFPRSLEFASNWLLWGCQNVRKVVFNGDAPDFERGVMEGSRDDLVIEVRRGSKGWDGPVSTELPLKWPKGTTARLIRYVGESDDEFTARRNRLREIPGTVRQAQVGDYLWSYTLNDEGAVLWCGVDEKHGDPCVSPRPAGKVVVPEQIDGHPVVELGALAFKDCQEIVQIVLPPTLKRIGNRAFMSCGKLQEIDLPPKVESIGLWAFNNCWALKRVNLANCAALDRGGGVFSFCPNLVEYQTAAGNDIFFRQGALYAKTGKKLLVVPSSARNFKMPSRLREIGDFALTGSWLESITVPASVERIGEGAFLQCLRLSRLVFEGDAPTVTVRDVPLFARANRNLVVYVRRGSKGWNGPGSTDLPEKWPVGDPDARPIRYLDR